MFSIIAYSLLGLSLLGLAVIAIRKFPQISLIDTGSIPQEREAKQKHEIVKRRVERMLAEGWQARAAKVTPIFGALQAWFRRQYGKIQALEQQMEKGMPVLVMDQPTHVQALFNEIESLVGAGKHAEAEKKYIEIISIDRRNLAAYRGLGEAYMAMKQFELARETFAFLAKAYRAEAGEDATAKAEAAKMHYASALACKGLEDMVCVRQAMGSAAELEPSNPKYLDLLLEACILTGDKVKAKEVFNAFRTANPENQKLETLYQTIVDMPEPKAAWKVTRVKNRP